MTADAWDTLWLLFGVGAFAIFLTLMLGLIVVLKIVSKDDDDDGYN